MTPIRRLQQYLDFHEDDPGLVIEDADLSALIECVKAQSEWIHAPQAVKTFKRAYYSNLRGDLRSAVLEAEKKVGLG